MIYFSDAEIDALLLEDIYRGDLTTSGLALQNVQGRMIFKRKNSGVVSGIDVAFRVLKKLGLSVQSFATEGMNVKAGEVILQSQGDVYALHQGWKVAQCVLEWSCGVAQYMYEMQEAAKLVNPQARILCTRKSIPNTRKLATQAILAGGGNIHRQGLSETVLVFKNHRQLLEDPNDFCKIVQQLRHHAPESKVVIEVENLTEFKQVMPSNPDIIQLDKFNLEEIKEAIDLKNQQSSTCILSIAGGVNKKNIADYASLGINLFITSAPYYAQPQDIKVIIEPNI